MKNSVRHSLHMLTQFSLFSHSEKLWKHRRKFTWHFSKYFSLSHSTLIRKNVERKTVYINRSKDKYLARSSLNTTKKASKYLLVGLDKSISSARGRKKSFYLQVGSPQDLGSFINIQLIGNLSSFLMKRVNVKPTKKSRLTFNWKLLSEINKVHPNVFWQVKSDVGGKSILISKKSISWKSETLILKINTFKSCLDSSPLSI